LLVEIRIAYTEIPSIASMHKYITTWIGSSLPDLFITSQSPSHSDLCHFKVTILGPLQWTHQTLSSFGFPTFPYSSCMSSPLSVWTKSNTLLHLFVLYFFFFGILWFKLRVLCLLSRHLSHSSQTFFCVGIFETGSHKLFAWSLF
jgi:hypothetical protein